MEVDAKCNDMCCVMYNEMGRDGHVPTDLNIGEGDYVNFEICLDCGRIQGRFPITDETVKNKLSN